MAAARSNLIDEREVRQDDPLNKRANRARHVTSQSQMDWASSSGLLPSYAGGEVSETPVLWITLMLAVAMGAVLM